MRKESSIPRSSDLFVYIRRAIDTVTLRCQISVPVNVPSHLLNLVSVKRNRFIMLRREMIFAEQRMPGQQRQARAEGRLAPLHLLFSAGTTNSRRVNSAPQDLHTPPLLLA